MIGGQVILQPIVIGQAETSGILEGPEQAARDIAAIDAAVKLAQGIAGIGGLEIVLGPEQPLPAGLALATRDRPECVETARDGRQEPLLRLHIRGDGSEQRWLRLIGPVGAAQSLNGRIGLPARFQEVVDPQALVLRPEIGVIAAPRAAGIREDQDALLVIHEGGGFREVGRARPGFDHEARRMTLALAHDAARPARHLGHEIGAEALDDLVKRPRHRRQACQMLDQRIAPARGLAAFHRLAVAR